MELIKSDGGRSKYFKGETDDCVCRAICNATGKDYMEIYNLINEVAKDEKIGKRKHKKSSARDGVYRSTIRKVMEQLGWEWKPLAMIGVEEKVHLNENELPTKGIYILKVSKHLTCIKDGKLYDNYDCTRSGERLVYGYWYNPKENN